MFKICLLSLSLLSLSLTLACRQTPEAQATDPPTRLVAIGDLHGDLAATRRALRLAGAIDEQDKWVGGTLQVVQTGDQLDRGDQELEILDLLDELAMQAQAAGGHLHVLNGNHEIMNVQGDLRYVTPRGFESFATLTGLDLTQPQLAEVPDFAKGRAAAFLPGGSYARKLSQRPVVLVLAETVFVHGGVLPQHASFGIDKLNQAYQSWLRGELPALPPELNDQDSPIWTRIYSDPRQAPDCERLAQTLQALKARRMVVGHSVQSEINSACEGQVWRIDTGMAQAYGGSVQVLELQGEQARVLKAPAGEP